MFASTLFCHCAGPKCVGNFALVLFGLVFFFQYSHTLGHAGHTASSMKAPICAGVSGTEPELTTAVSSQSSSLAAFVTWICLQPVLSF